MAENESCDWSTLPSEIVHLISTKLSDLSDVVRLRAVCKSWQLAVSLLNFSSPCLPWLLARRATDETNKLCYYSLSSNKTYKIQLPHQQPKDSYFLSSAGGRLLCSQDHCFSRPLSLFNPLTGIAVSLPPLIEGLFNLEVVSSNLSQEEFVAVLSVCSYTDDNVFFSVMRPGEEAWVTFLLDMPYNEAAGVYHEGLYYINDCCYEETWIMDSIGGMVATVPSHVLSSSPIARQYILESCGEILIILRHFSSKLEDVSFSIFRLDRDVNRDYQWVKVRGMSDQILFLNQYTGFSLPSSDFQRFKGNCIYFLEDELKLPLLRRHDLENGTTETLSNFFGDKGTWFFPKFV